jgi:Ca-activated chloride channel family protein
MPAFDTLSIQWPFGFYLFALIPLFMIMYWRMKTPLSDLSRRLQEIPGYQQQMRHAKRWQWLSASLLLIGLCCLLFAMTRPRAVLYVPSRLDTIMIALDTSGSMRASDIAPSRIDASIAAIKQFIAAQPPQLRIGIVTIASTAALRQAPTTDRVTLMQALENIPLQPGSAIGSGIVIALANLLPGSGIDAEKIITESEPGTSARSPSPLPNTTNQVNMEPGSNQSMAIVLITDGQSNMGPDALKMAELAANHGVKIHTVGIGTTEGVVIQSQGMSMRVRLDESALKKIANGTLGQYYRASETADLKNIYDSLGLTIRFERQQLTEITGPVLGLGILFIFMGCGVSFMRFGRIV